MPTTLLTPIDGGPARPVGASRLWRKQLLPLGEITYKGRKIRFDREYLAGLAKAFTSKAYDQVPFQLADAPNSHTNDPERFRGEIRGFEVAGDGLDLILAATEAGDKVLRENPDLGVSARIVEDYERADGKFFPAAVQHVLGTLDPRITGMRPWQAVEAANEDDGEVIDLTGMDYPTPDDPDPAPAGPVITQPEETSMALTTDQEARLSRLLDLPEDQFDALLTAPAAPDAADGTEGDTDDTEPTLTDAELQALVDSLPGDGPAEPVITPEPALAGAQLAAEAQAAIDLANSRADETASELSSIRAQLDRATYETERDHFQRSLGVPARITDLARPVLEGSGRVVELANGSSVDAGAIVRKLIGEFGRTMKALGMSVELGNAEGADDTAGAAERAAEERAALVSGYIAANAL